MEAHSASSTSMDSSGSPDSSSEISGLELKADPLFAASSAQPASRSDTERLLLEVFPPSSDGPTVWVADVCMVSKGDAFGLALPLDFPEHPSVSS